MTRKEITLRFLLDTLRQSKGGYSYDFGLPDSVEEGWFLYNCAVEVLKAEPPPPYAPPSTGMVRHMTFGGDTRESKTAEEIYPIAADILWLLSRKGILRPGVRSYNRQATSTGEGYSLTLKGREWIKNYSEEDVQELLADL